MKKSFCLLLALLLLLCCVGCKEEPAPTPEKYKGTLHSIDGVTQNTAVRMEVTGIDTVNHTFDCILYNDTDYELGYNDILIEKIGVWLWSDGEWLKLSNINMEHYVTSDLHKLAPQSSVEKQVTFAVDNEYSLPEAGAYRVILFEAGLEGLENDDPFSHFTICAYYSTDTSTPTPPQS